MSTSQATATRQSPHRAVEVTGESLVAALDETIDRVRVGAGYQLGLLAVTLIMLLLPLIYVALILLVARLVIWHAGSNTVILQSMGHGRGAIVAVIVYVAPMVVGGLLIAFMIKPLFARRAQRSAPLTLSRSQQRILYTFVDKLAGIVGARRPCRIDVDCQVNASASFRDGLRGLLTGELVLTLGLPLMAGLTAREFAGVVAHEFGHFTQGTGMRLTYVVRSINAWFARVVYERDSWDEWLVDLSRSDAHWSINLTAGLARMLVWVTRRALWALMWVGHFVSSFMLRQMEFDADRYEARVAGGDAFAQTCRKMMALNLAQNAAFGDLTAAWREKRLGDDLTKLVLSRERGMPAEVRKNIDSHIDANKTGWFDSHPSDRDRIASAGREATDGIFRHDTPARSLLEEFDDLSRRATELFYRENLGQQFRADYVVKTDAIVEQQSEQQEANKSLQRFFQGLVHPVRPVFPDRQSDHGLEGAADMLLTARNQLLESIPAARDAAKKFDEADGKLMKLLQTQTQQRAAGAIRRPADDEAQRLLERPRAEALAALHAVLRGALVRLDLCLKLEREATQTAPAKPAQGDYALIEEGSTADAQLAGLAALARAADKIEELRRDFSILSAALALVKPNTNSEALVSLVLQRTRHTQDLLTQVHTLLRAARYPYHHSDGEISISRFALAQLPGVEDVGGVYGAAETTLESYYGLYARLMGDVARRAENVEESLGLMPLPEPSE